MQGRFTTVDPIMIHDDRLEEPQRLNLYEYCPNNPLGFIDPNGLDDITYNQSGQEISRTDHHGRLWHLFRSDTWHLRANDGRTYNLDSPLRQLPNGQTYTIIDKDQTWQMLTSFVNSNRRRSNERPITYSETTRKAFDPSRWNWKIKLNREFGPHALFVFDSAAHPSDYIGNVAFGFIMASYQYTETMAKFGAGVAQLGIGRPEGGPTNFFDDPRDQEAIHKGFDLYRAGWIPYPSTKGLRLGPPRFYPPWRWPGSP